MDKQQNVMLGTLRSKLFGFFVGCMVMGIAIGMTPNVSFAQSDQPDAGTTIGNQATATYEDNGGNARTVTSNTVETTVQQVAAVSITQGTTQQVAPGGQVLFPHTITNNGNGTDTFKLDASEVSPDGGDFDFDNIQIYEDTNGDGVPEDLNDPIEYSDPVDRGNSYSFVVVAQVPTSPTTANGYEEAISVTATTQLSNSSASATSSPVNKAIVSENAVVSVVKSQSTGTGNVDDTITITLQFTNTGNSDASNLVLKDEIPAGFGYVENSATLMGASVKDAEGDGDNFTFTDNGGTGTDLVEATVPTLSYNQQGTLTFEVKIAEGTEGDVINNTGTFIHGDLNDEQSTNTTTFTVNENYQVVTVDENGDANDVDTPETVTIANKEQGATVNFVNTFQNNGSTADRFNITWDEDDEYPFPNGRTITLYKTDGNGTPTSPLTTDSNGDGDPDIGPIDPGEQFQVVLQVQLPASAKGGPQSVDVTATSIMDAGATATFTDVLTEISANQVDITNGDPVEEATNQGEGVETFEDASSNTAITAKSTNPGTTTSFTLYINNTSGPSDNYNLVAGSNNAGSFSAGLPSGFSVQFRDPDNGNAVITNTGNILSGGNKKVTAVVTVASDAAPGTQDIYFRARSSSSGAVDFKRDAVNVNAVRNLTLVANQSGQLAPGGSTTYLHTLTNEGNVVENEGTNSQLQLNLKNTIGNGWQAAVFYDADGTGTITSDDIQIATAGSSGSLFDDGGGTNIIGQLNSGDSVDFIVRVTTTPGVNTNNDNTTTLTVEDNGNGQPVNNVEATDLTVDVEDITTIVVGNVVINKRQRNVTQKPSGPFGTGDIDAAPGEVLEYELVVTNQGQAKVKTINLTDNTPAFTKMSGDVEFFFPSSEGSPSETISSGENPTFQIYSGNTDVTISRPADGTSGTLEVTVGSLAAGDSYKVRFKVKINN